jgi:AraC-like DNA-binding protein
LGFHPKENYNQSGNVEDMDYTEFSPSNEISAFVKCFWEYRNRGNDIRHTIFPNGHFELFMIFEQQHLAYVFLSGLRTKPFDVEVPQGVTVSAIRFKLLAAEYVFAIDIRSLLDTIIPLDLHYWNLKESEQLSFKDRISEITGKIYGMIREKKVAPEKLLLLETVYKPGLTVKELSGIIQWDRRKINRYFNNQFGLSLKTFLNIVRLRSSFESVKEGILYPEQNYYDQSHYIKEVKKYTGKSPKQLSKNEDDRFLQFSLKKKP